MTRFTFLVVLSIVSVALGQVSQSDYQRKLAELNSKAQKQATTRPADPSLRASTRPTAAPQTYRWVAKEGAPFYVKDWIAKQPYIQQALLQSKIDDDRDDLASEVDRMRAEIAKLEKGGNFERSSGGGIGKKDWVDREAEKAWADQLRAKRARLGELARRLREVDENAPKRLAEARQNPKIMTALVAGEDLDDLAIGKAGSIGKVQIERIVDDSNMIVRLQRGGGGNLWCKGFSTEGIVDDQTKHLDGCIITGTKREFGRTMFVAEPFDVDEWIELVPTDAFNMPTSQPTVLKKAAIR